MYSRKIKGKVLTFGVSGLLYKTNVLMYDRQTESLWSQVKRQAVTGPMTGTKLRKLPSTLTTWKKWKKRYPETEVLSLDTGFTRDYSRDPYENYYKRKEGFFAFLRNGPVKDEKRLVAGVKIDDAAKAYPVDVLRNQGTVTDRLGNNQIRLMYDKRTDALTVTDAKGIEIPHIIVYWFVWKDFNPGSEMYTGP